MRMAKRIGDVGEDMLNLIARHRSVLADDLPNSAARDTIHY
jgi:hypothetical protein